MLRIRVVRWITRSASYFYPATILPLSCRFRQVSHYPAARYWRVGLAAPGGSDPPAALLCSCHCRRPGRRLRAAVLAQPSDEGSAKGIFAASTPPRVAALEAIAELRILIRGLLHRYAHPATRLHAHDDRPSSRGRLRRQAW